MAYKNKEDYNRWKRNHYRKNREKELARKKAYHATDRGRAVLYASIERYRKKYPEKLRARQMIQAQVRAGEIEKLNCLCGAKGTQAHHEDYSKPLEVIWLCSTCHGQRHSRYELCKKCSLE